MDTPAAYARATRYIAGLDIGQMHDASALAVLDTDVALVEGTVRPRFDARWLERFPLQTPYPRLATLVRERLERLGQRCVLVVDVTGVGRGIVDLFRESWMTVDPVTQERIVRPGKPAIVAVTLLTSAMHAPTSPSWDEHHVPKRDIVMTFMVALQQHRFRAAKGLKEAAVLFKEGQNFQWKVSASGQDQYGAWREGQHDDLLLATAMGVWWGERFTRPGRALAGAQQYATASASPLVPRRETRRPQMASGGYRRG